MRPIPRPTKLASWDTSRTSTSTSTSTRSRSPDTSPATRTTVGRFTAGLSSAPQSNSGGPRASRPPAEHRAPPCRCPTSLATSLKAFIVGGSVPGWLSAINHAGCCWGHGRVPGGAPSPFRCWRPPGTPGLSHGGRSACAQCSFFSRSCGPSNRSPSTPTTATKVLEAVRRSHLVIEDRAASTGTAASAR